MTNAYSVPFALGAYFGWGTAPFEASINGFVSTMGTKPQFNDSFMDLTQPVSGWVANANAAAIASAQFARSITPVIDLPMASTATGSMTTDQQFKAFASGQYDSMLRGIVDAWVKQGFTNLVFRPGSEMNLTGVDYAGSSAQSQADWVTAFQHIYTVLHQAAAVDGINVQIVWNPATDIFSNTQATTSLYPGDAYVDIIGADIYSDIYPPADAWPTRTYHDWATGGEDTSVAQFIDNPVNREHYWANPGATVQPNNINSLSQSLDDLLRFAEQHNKPFAIPETGAGNSNAGIDVTDDAAFPQWLSQQLTTAEATGLKIAFVNIWDSNNVGNYAFSDPSDGKPLEAAAWAQYFGAQSMNVLIVGAIADQALLNQTSIEPLSKLRIVDGDNQVEVVTVTESKAANGTLSNLGGGRYNVLTGVYTVNGSAATVTAALEGLVFTPATTPGQVITNFTVSASDANTTATDSTTTVISGSASTVIARSGSSVTGGPGLLTVIDTLGFNTITGGTGGMNATVSGSYAHIIATVSATVALTGSGNIVTGGTGRLTITDTRTNNTNNTIIGGIGGIMATINAMYDVITTQAGSSNTIALGLSGNIVHSNGTDTITAGPSNETIIATGNATIRGGTGYSTYTLSGTDSLTSTGSDKVIVTGGSSSIRASGNAITISQSAGTVRLTETGGGDNDAVTVIGAATMTGGAGRGGLAITTGSKDATRVTLSSGNNTVTSLNADTIDAGNGLTVLTESRFGATFIAGTGSARVTEGAGVSHLQFGSGSTTVYGGSGQGLYSFINGSGGGQDTIYNFRANVDQLAFSKFVGSAVSSEAVIGGSLNINLTDHTQITLMNVTQQIAFS